MKIEDQVCDIRQAAILSELGVKQKSIWYWEKMREPVSAGCATERVQLYANVGHPLPASLVEKVYSAFTVSELGLMLPGTLIKHFDFPGHKIPESRNYALDFNCWFFNDQDDEKRLFGCRYDHAGNINIGTENSYGTEAQSRAGLVIHLITSGLITVDQVNQQLSLVS